MTSTSDIWRLDHCSADKTDKDNEHDTVTRCSVQAAGVILAGGKARRMGGLDKGLVRLNGKAMVTYIANALKPQVSRVLINANRNQKTYADLTGLSVISDHIGDYAGPLAGMASAMSYISLPYLVAVPCDSPLLSEDLVIRLYESVTEKQADIAMARHQDKLQPVFVMLKRDLLPSLVDFLTSGGRKIIDWYYIHNVTEVDFSDAPLMFENVNTEQDLSRLGKQILASETTSLCVRS
ncbi:MAG: molybdenum cofactor guanylyltransferase MobA [Gammaproteobacteria bacterium]|jgi:molybdopterin-guanine dinucleotide biosynthesis protein A